MRKLTYAFAGAALTALLAGPALAASATSNAVGIGDPNDVQLLNDSQNHEMPILFTGIKTSQQKDLVMGVSLECGLTTRTTVKGQKGSKSTSTASSAVKVAVYLDYGTVDERMANPGWVTFCSRTQELSAVLGGVLESCTVNLTDTDGDGIPDTADFTKDDCEFTDEEISLMLDTMNANHYNFTMTNVGTAGSEGHTVTVMARVKSQAEGDGTHLKDAAANAYIGSGALIVDEIRLGHDIVIGDGTP